MLSSISIWVIIFFIACNDLMKNKIPNKLLALLFVLGILLGFGDLGMKDQFLGFLVYFIFGLILYFLKVMSAGDVKLLGVVGSLFGASSFFSVGYYILISCGLVGTMYLFLYKANALTVSEGSLCTNPINNQVHTRYGEKIAMPFAPSVVIGLAMYSYFT